MSQLFDQAIERARALSDRRQDEVGEMVLAMVEQEHSLHRLTEAQRAEVRRRLANPGPFASAQESVEFFRKLVG